MPYRLVLYQSPEEYAVGLGTTTEEDTHLKTLTRKTRRTLNNMLEKVLRKRVREQAAFPVEDATAETPTFAPGNLLPEERITEPRR